MDQISDHNGNLPAPRPRGNGPLTILALILVTVVAIVQRPGAPDPAKLARARAGITVQPVSISPIVGSGKVMLMFEAESKEPVPEIYVKQFVDDWAGTAPDRFRAAILDGELLGDQAREERFAELEKDLDEKSPLRDDIQTVRALVAAKEGGSPPPDAAAIQAFKDRHGWFARLLTSKGDPAAEAALQAENERGGTRLIIVIGVFFAWLVFAILLGIGLLIFGIVKLSSGTLRTRFARTPEALGSDRGLWLETFCVFLLGFLIVHFIGFGLSNLAGKDATWPTALLLLLQWSLAIVVFWPVVRGMSWERFRGELGWHRGRGFFREVGAGILGYLAGLPIYFLMALLMAAVMAIRQAIESRGHPGQPRADVPMPDNKIFDLISGNSGWVLLLLGSLVVIWAPLVEESIFRGALYRHLRGRLPVLLSVILVATAFGLAHAYVVEGVIMVAVLGGIFALMREWRGSLIAPMTAHCLHNSTVLTLLLLLLPVMRG